MIWKVRAMPSVDALMRRQARSRRGRRTGSFPAVGGKKPLIRLKKVVLPAPFGPMIARSSPVGTASETSRTAARLPKRLLTFLDFEQAHAAVSAG